MNEFGPVRCRHKIKQWTDSCPYPLQTFRISVTAHLKAASLSRHNSNVTVLSTNALQQLTHPSCSKATVKLNLATPMQFCDPSFICKDKSLPPHSLERLTDEESLTFPASSVSWRSSSKCRLTNRLTACPHPPQLLAVQICRMMLIIYAHTFLNWLLISVSKCPEPKDL